VAILTRTGEGGTKGQGFDDLYEDEFEELDTITDTAVRSPDLRTKS
jgi:hypothetical protein